MLLESMNIPITMKLMAIYLDGHYGFLEINSQDRLSQALHFGNWMQRRCAEYNSTS